MELNEIATIIQGNIPTRIETVNGYSVETITMQELNYVANLSDELPEKKYLSVKDNNMNSYSITKVNDVIIGLSSGKSIVIASDRTDKLVLSNLAIIRIKDTSNIDPNYLCWYINTNTTAIKKMQQGTYAVSIIPLSMLKSFEIKMISIQKQRLIGQIYELKRKRDRLTQMIESKKAEVLSQKLLKIFTKENENGCK